MFRVTMMAMAYTQQEQLAMIRKLGRQIEQLQNIISVLRGLSGFESVISVLQAEEKELEQEKKVLVHMMNALNTIENSYREAESRNLTDGLS